MGPLRMWPDDLLAEMSAEERAISVLLRDAHLAADFDLPELFDRHAIAMGVRDAVAYLADLQQRVLVPFLVPGGAGHEENLEPLSVEATLAGRTYRQGRVLSQPLEGTAPEVRVWLPLLDGTERVGVLAVTAASMDVLDANGGVLRGRLMRFASLAAELIMTKTMYGDTVVRLRRTQRMGLAAEMQWSLLPPLTFANSLVTIAGALEPAYEVAGDSLDYAVLPGRVQLAIFDGMGHGLRSAQLASLAVAAYRNARREGVPLAATVHAIEAAVSAGFGGDAFLTGQVAELDSDSGMLTWINAGHPGPLLLRGTRLVKTLEATPILPFGLGDLLAEPHGASIGAEPLEPGDLVLFYSDGVIEARSPSGEFFGGDRLVDLVVRNLAAGLPAPETMRRVIRALLDHQEGQLDDDASLLLLQHRPAQQEDLLPA
ncbi:MAG: PP2C family protein-serine/threonine phosphatase [Actinomycetes bacterium]